MKGKSIINFLAYFAIAFIAVALVLGKIFQAFKLGVVFDALSLVAQIIAYSITAVYAFQFAKSKKSIGWMIAFIIFIILIALFLILGIF